MTANNSDRSVIRNIIPNEQREAYFKSLLPRSVVRYVLLDCPSNLTWESVYQVYRQYGDRTTSTLKVAMGLDTRTIYGQDHPQDADRVLAAINRGTMG